MRGYLLAALSVIAIASAATGGCEVNTDCASCTLASVNAWQPTYCSWCPDSNSCINASATVCPNNATHISYPGLCGLPTDPCAQFTMCNGVNVSGCNYHLRCGWCADSFSCASGNSNGPIPNLSYTCYEWAWGAMCGNDPCSEGNYDCNSCLKSQWCQWCDKTATCANKKIAQCTLEPQTGTCRNTFAYGYGPWRSECDPATGLRYRDFWCTSNLGNNVSYLNCQSYTGKGPDASKACEAPSDLCNGDTSDLCAYCRQTALLENPSASDCDASSTMYHHACGCTGTGVCSCSAELSKTGKGIIAGATVGGVGILVAVLIIWRRRKRTTTETLPLLL